MRLLLAALLLLGLWAVSNQSQAQVAGCAPGTIPYTVPGVSTCLPGVADGNQQQAPQAPQQPQWQERWGAIATDESHGVLGAVTGRATQGEAENDAIADCHAKGGSICKLEMPYANGCIAFTVSDSGYNAAADSTVDEAAKIGMDTCKKAGAGNCHVYYSACSPAVRIR